MAFFDYAVRPDSQPPPWKQLFFLNIGGVRFSSHIVLQATLIVFFHCYGYRKLGFLCGFLPYVLILHKIVSLYADGMLSNNFGKCIQNLRSAGFSDGTIFWIGEFNAVSSQLFGYVIMVYVVEDGDVLTWGHALQHTNLALLGKVLINMILAEILFFFGHGLMHVHPTLMKLHVMHHCCTTPSWNTNTLFHPIDLAIEFGGPVLGLLAMHHWVWNKDDFLLAVTYVIFQLWYACDHDENMQLYHVQHHSWCDSNYAIYTKLFGVPRANTLRDYIQQRFPTLVWPNKTSAARAQAERIIEKTQPQSHPAIRSSQRRVC